MRAAHGLGFLVEAKAIGVLRGGGTRGRRLIIGIYVVFWIEG